MARELAGNALALMGGTSNFSIIKEGTPETIADDVAEKLQHRINVIGPECAVPLDVPHSNLELLVREVHRRSAGILPYPSPKPPTTTSDTST